MDQKKRALPNPSHTTDSQHTSKLLDALDAVRRENPDFKEEVSDRLKKFDEEQAERWKHRFVDDN